MLQEVMDYIHNYFVKAPYRGTFTLAADTVSPALGLKDGQRILITGSDLNDGVYTWHEYGILDDDDKEAAGLQDETFTGAICALAVPPQLIALSEEIKKWVETNREVMESPMASESFNGYSYSLKTGSSTGGDSAGQIGWQNIYGKRLERWRKLCP